MVLIAVRTVLVTGTDGCERDCRDVAVAEAVDDVVDNGGGSGAAGNTAVVVEAVAIVVGDGSGVCDTEVG